MGLDKALPTDYKNWFTDSSCSLTEWRQESLPHIIGFISSNCSKNMYCTVPSLVLYLYVLILKNQKWRTCLILFKFALPFYMLRNINMVFPLPKIIFFPSLWSLHNFIILILYLHKNLSLFNSTHVSWGILGYIFQKSLYQNHCIWYFSFKCLFVFLCI